MPRGPGRTTRIVVLTSISLALVQLPGCITSERSKYERHLTTRIAQSPGAADLETDDALLPPALAAVGDEQGP